MINGYLHAQGRNIADGAGEKVLLKGWGLGNWLLQEGYMWCASGKRFDRPRRIEAVVEELAGKKYADGFWKKFRENYVRREDIFKMARLGYNSVRIPFSYRHFMEDEPGINWKEEGFDLLDRCIGWCAEAGIYAFLDLHGAPGGQTGANIDDSVDDIPRLFIDRHQWDRAAALWRKLAERYADCDTVGGYDLLNEPIAPPGAGGGDFDYLIPRLKEFYEEVISEIRRVDKKHMLSIEGAHWATDLRIFDHKYDDNMVLHFHRYAENPDIACLKPYMEKAAELDIPLWLGETGENTNEWYAALYPLSESLGIGYNIWPWKKMSCTNSPYSIQKPEDYEKILGYINGGPHPGYLGAQKIFDEYLENIKIENCKENLSVTCHVLRRAPFCLRATDFDECPGRGISFSGTAEEENSIDYRRGCGMKLLELNAKEEKRFGFDCQWDRYGLVMEEGEFACYRLDAGKDIALNLNLEGQKDSSVLEISGMESGMRRIIRMEPGDSEVSAAVQKGETGIRIMVREGKVCIVRLEFQ